MGPPQKKRARPLAVPSVPQAAIEQRLHFVWPGRADNSVLGLSAAQLLAAACAWRVLSSTVIAVATRPATSPAFAGRISVLLVLARWAKASTYCVATLRLAASIPPLS